jgi:hypothetical protein
MGNDQILYNVGDLVKLSTYAVDSYSHLKAFQVYLESVGIIVSPLKEMKGIGAGYKVRFPSTDVVFFVADELELVRAV